LGGCGGGGGMRGGRYGGGERNGGGRFVLIRWIGGKVEKEKERRGGG